MNIKETKSYFIETYGCQMNVADSELVSGLLTKDGYSEAKDIYNAVDKLLSDKQVLEKQVTKFQGIISKFKTEKSSEIASKVLLNHL